MKKVWEKIKKWVVETSLPWLKKEWMQIVNLLVLFIVYGVVNEAENPGLSTIVGLWIFVLIIYYIFWKFFGLDKVVKSFKEQRKEK